MGKKLAKSLFAGAALALMLTASGPMSAAPSVYPTGTTIYHQDEAYNGYTVLSLLGTAGVVVVDMNGRVVKQWDDFNLGGGGPARILPGGVVIAPQGAVPGHLENDALVARDFDGNEIWRFAHNEELEVEGETRWSARQHHDWQLSSFPAGYYSPDYTPRREGGRLLMLTHSSHTDTDIADVSLDDDRLIELNNSGDIAWEWRAGDHIDEFGFDAEERAAIRRGGQRDNFDWFHINSATYVGPNKLHDAGDQRFHPDNVIISSRQTSIVAIIARDGSIAWQLGPDYSDDPGQMELGQIVGQHHAHFIPKGLPGAGNMMIFDNGGSGGYGAPNALSSNGQTNYRRHDSRVIEINPLTLEVIWEYRAANFYSFNISGAQRLPNGNTLITEGAPGRVFEVNSDNEIVWEYMQAPGEGRFASNAVYRAYRLPYSWIPQLEIPVQTSLKRPERGTFHVPGTPE